MERLTYERLNGIRNGYWSPNKKQELVDRLAAYENTDLDPEQVEHVKETAKKYLLEKAQGKACGWIPAEEKPSEDGFYVATMSGALVDQEEPFVGLAEFDDGEWVDGDDVIAWRPMPEVYRPVDKTERSEQKCFCGCVL